MSSSNANKNLEVVTYLEAFFILLVFAVVLYVLYPKDMLQRQVLAENSNYDLTALYLENMLRLEPENKTLMLALLKSSLKSGKYDLSLKMIEALQKNEDTSLQFLLSKSRFEAMKIKYFSTNEKKLQTEIKNEMLVFLDTIIQQKRYSDDELEYWYRGTREFSLQRSALFFLQQLLMREEKKQWLEECFYLSSDLKDEKAQNSCLNKLRGLDEEGYERWTKEAYYLAVAEGKTGHAVSLLKAMAERSKRWRIELAKYYVEIKEFKASSKEYMRLYKGALSYKEKTEYFLKALQALEYGALMEDAVSLARDYERLYYKDKRISRRLIKLYLAAGKLEDAKRISIKRLKFME